MSKYFYKYSNGDKWVQINGDGETPEKCKITWDCSKNNADIHAVMIEKTARSPLYGWFKFDDPKLAKNIYAQVLRINSLIRLGYTCEKYNAPKVDPLPADPIEEKEAD